MSKFNFDPEFFRRVIIGSEKTEKIPPLVQIIREALEMFYSEFDYYPDLAAYAPGTVTVFGDHLEYVKGNLVQAALPLGAVIVGKSHSCLKCKVVTSSRDVIGPTKFAFPISRYRKNLKVFPQWVSLIKGVMNNFPLKDIKGFDAVLNSTVPINRGWGSSAAVQVGFYTLLEAVVGEKTCEYKKGWLCQFSEKKSRSSEEVLGTCSNFTSSIAKANSCLRINCRTNEISFFEMKDINILFLLTYPNFDIERKDRDLVQRRKTELYLAAKLLGLEEIIDATEEHLSVLANMEDPTKEKVKEILRGLDLTDCFIDEFIEDLFYCPKTPTVMTEDYLEEEKVVMHGEEVLYEEDLEDLTVKIDQEPCKAPENCAEKTSVGYMQQRIAELCEGLVGNSMSVQQKICEEINCLGGIENLSIASGVTVCGKLLRRVRHIVTENLRSLSVADVMSKLDYEELGAKLIQSHLSLKLDYDVSCPTLDGLVQLAIDSERVYGAKMISGGGTLTLLHRSVVEKFVGKVVEKYGDKFEFYLIFPNSGARILNMGARKNETSVLSNNFLNRDQAFQKAIENFEATYKYRPTHGSFSPAPINIIGDLTDCYHGFILSMGTNIHVVVVGAPNGTEKIRVTTTSDVGNESQKSIFFTPETGNLRPGHIKWVNTIKGVVTGFKGTVKGFDCLIQSSMPLNSGSLNKSTLVMAFYTFLEELSNEKKVSSQEKAYQCMLAVHTFSGCVFGISEQLVIAKSKENNLVLVDSGSSSTTLIPFEDPSVTFLLVYTDVQVQAQRALFFTRLEECYQLATVLGRKSLRCLTVKELNGLKERLKDKISETSFRRAKYVVSENARALKASEALKNCDFDALGELMVASHKSLKDDFEVICPEVDELVSLAMEVDGVFGSKALCSGPVNSTLSLVKHWAVDDLIEHLQKSSTCHKLSFYLLNTANACGSCSLDKYLEKLPSPQFVFEHVFPY